jgi:hypothetical protein
MYAAEDGLADNPLDALDKMRETFIMLDTSTPFAWILSLRSFGKQIRDSITSLGYIQWSEDVQQICYRDLEPGWSRSERAEDRGGARLLRSLRRGFCSLRSARSFEAWHSRGICGSGRSIAQLNNVVIHDLF